ncbi:hypothetical protein TSUD_271740 [Trifolium subterraneum]|uniref:Uncharacterized protein n=1 Tax=Trifolium subterraneum TaxID=3900 RepID=A0A2Z6NZZ0_TRISU|nr:hypothetical protein TSUD_271740 [Trifolium subterraneum]
MLQTVFLGGNYFISIPDSCFQGLTSLQKLSMASNINLAPWTFPIELSESPNLVSLDLGETNLMGHLPDMFDTLVKPGQQHVWNHGFYIRACFNDPLDSSLAYGKQLHRSDS